MQLIKQSGILATDCPKFDCSDTCRECDHIDYVYGLNGSLASNDDLKYLIDGILEVHEEYIIELCNYQPDICMRGNIASFPCVQCGVIDPLCITYGTPFNCASTCRSLNCATYVPIDYESCEQSTADLSDVAYLADYTVMLQAVETTRGYANGETLVNFIKNIYNSCELLYIMDGIYHVSLGPLVSIKLELLPILARVVPLPIGAKIKFYYSDC